MDANRFGFDQPPATRDQAVAFVKQLGEQIAELNRNLKLLSTLHDATISAFGLDEPDFGAEPFLRLRPTARPPADMGDGSAAAVGSVQ